MSVTPNGHPSSRNILLNAMPGAAREAIANAGDDVELVLKDVLYDILEPVRHVWFPYTGVVSWLSTDGSGNLVEVATVGKEGFVGMPVFLGAGATTGRGMVQIAGAGLRVAAADFQRIVEAHEPSRAVLNRYTQALFAQIAQGVVCNRVHSIDERCARWLLMTHDRVDGDTYLLTQEFLAQMLGVRRASVTVAAGILQKAGFIDYSRGKITIVDRAGLEGATCDCYWIVRHEFERLLGADTG